MKLRTAVIAGSLLFAAGHTGMVSAHGLSGSLGDSPTAADIYKISCFDDGNGAPARLEFQGADLAPVAPPLIRFVVKKGGRKKISTDFVDNDGQDSALKALSKRGGIYTLVVRKNNTAGSENYSADFHCMTSSGVHTGTEVVFQTQNQ